MVALCALENTGVRGNCGGFSFSRRKFTLLFEQPVVVVCALEYGGLHVLGAGCGWFSISKQR